MMDREWKQMEKTRENESSKSRQEEEGRVKWKVVEKLFRSAAKEEADVARIHLKTTTRTALN